MISKKTVVVIAEEDLEILHQKMDILMEEMEPLYEDVIPKWSGNTKVFEPLNSLVKKLFASRSL